MTETAATGSGAPRRHLQSAGAVLAGFLVILILTIPTDQALHAAGVYPPWGDPMHEPALNLLALSYRLFYAIAGGLAAAWLAPRAPVAHALVLGGIGTVVAGLGAAAAISAGMGPVWFPLALVATALPCAWLGGLAHGLLRRG